MIPVAVKMMEAKFVTFPKVVKIHLGPLRIKDL